MENRDFSLKVEISSEKVVAFCSKVLTLRNRNFYVLARNCKSRNF